MCDVERRGEGRRSCSLSPSPWALSEILKPEQRWLAGPADCWPLFSFHRLLLPTGDIAALKGLVLTLGEHSGPQGITSSPFPPLLTP